MPDDALVPYVSLLRDFLEGKIDAAFFERRYIDTFKGEDHFFADDAFSVLDSLFADVDAFCADGQVRAGTTDALCEQQLRDRCAQALARLEDMA